MSLKAHVLKPSLLSYYTIRKLTNLRSWSLGVKSQSVYRILRHQPFPVSIFASWSLWGEWLPDLMPSPAPRNALAGCRLKGNR